MSLLHGARDGRVQLVNMDDTGLIASSNGTPDKVEESGLTWLRPTWVEGVVYSRWMVEFNSRPRTAKSPGSASVV